MTIERDGGGVEIKKHFFSQHLAFALFLPQYGGVTDEKQFLRHLTLVIMRQVALSRRIIGDSFPHLPTLFGYFSAMLVVCFCVFDLSQHPILDSRTAFPTNKHASSHHRTLHLITHYWQYTNGNPFNPFNPFLLLRKVNIPYLTESPRPNSHLLHGGPPSANQKQA